MTDVELREQRAKVDADAWAIIQKAEADKRTLTAEEQEHWDKLYAESQSIKETQERRAKQQAEQKELEKVEERQAEPAQPGAGEKRGGEAYHRNVERGQDDRRAALRAWLLSGSTAPIRDSDREAAQRCGVDLRNRNLPFNLYDSSAFDVPARRGRAPTDLEKYEARALGTTSGAVGGNLVPTGFVRNVETALLTFGGMREVSNIIRTEEGNSLPIPSINDTGNVGAILAENTQVAEQDVAFGQVTMTSYKYSSKMVRVSVELLQDSAVNVESILGRALGERIGRITNTHFTTGTGTGQPQGVVTGAAQGVVAATGGATSITFANLVSLVHSVDPAWRANARFMMHDTTLRAIKQMVDAQNRPLWLAGMASGEPDTILGYPYTINQDMPVMAANAKSVLFGDFSVYWIRDVLGLTLVRDDSRFVDFHQVAFLAFSRHDGRIVDPGANALKYFQNSAT